MSGEPNRPAKVSVEQRLAELDVQLPQPPPPVANYAGAVRTGNLVFVSGHGPYKGGKYHWIGKVDSEVPVEEARKAARLTILNALASLKAEIGSLDRVTRVVKLLGMVNSDPTFKRQPEVINGASDLLEQIFGSKHARSAVGLGALPMGIAVEIEMIVEIEG